METATNTLGKKTAIHDQFYIRKHR